MKKFLSLICFCLCSFFMYSQTCEEMNTEYEHYAAKYKTLSKTSEKKECVKQIKRILDWGKEANCGFPQRWYSELKQIENALYSPPVFVQSDYFFDAVQGVAKIGVKTKKGVTFKSYPQWMMPVETTDNKSFEFSLGDNQLPYERNGVVEVEYSKKRYQCNVIQEPAAFQALVTGFLDFGPDEENGSIQINTNDTAWTVWSNATWLLTESTDDGVKVVCEKNPDKKTRSAKISIRFACGEVRNVDVKQAIGRTSLSVSSNSLFFDHEGGTNNDVVVKCNYGKWSASSSAKWLTVKVKNGNISIKCKRNKMGFVRTCKIRIKSDDEENVVEEISVVQEKAPVFKNIGKGIKKAANEVGDFFKGRKSKKNNETNKDTSNNTQSSTSDNNFVPVVSSSSVYLLAEGEIGSLITFPDNSKGVVFLKNADGTGLAVSLDMTKTKWQDVKKSKDCQNISRIQDGEGERSCDVGLGKIYTSAIISQLGSTALAAQWCVNHGNGWYLPSSGELAYLFSVNTKNGGIIDSAMRMNGGLELIDDWHWSSSENDDDEAINVSLSGYMGAEKKIEEITVRAVRAF